MNNKWLVSSLQLVLDTYSEGGTKNKVGRPFKELGSGSLFLLCEHAKTVAPEIVFKGIYLVYLVLKGLKLKIPLFIVFKTVFDHN